MAEVPVSRVVPVVATGAGAPCAGAVHLQLRRLEHERDDHGHQRRPGHDGPGRPDRHHRVSSGHGGVDDSRRQADGQVGTEAVFHPRSDHLRHRRLSECRVAGDRGPPGGQLDLGRRRHGAADPTRLHPHHDAVHRRHVARQGVRCDHRHGRYRRGGRAADRWPHHHGPQLAMGVRVPGRDRGHHRRAQPQDRRSRSSGPGPPVRHPRRGPVRLRPRPHRHGRSRRRQQPLADAGAC